MALFLCLSLKCCYFADFVVHFPCFSLFILYFLSVKLYIYGISVHTNAKDSQILFF